MTRNDPLFLRRLDFPTSLAFTDRGILCVAESGLVFDGAPQNGGRAFMLRGRDATAVPLIGGLRAPVNGLTFHDGSFYLAEGGNPGRLSRVALSGEQTVIVDGLPGFGNYHTNMALVGPDGKLYFSQGAMTNSGVVGLDSLRLAWLRTLPHDCDRPGYDVVLNGVDFETENPLDDDGPSKTGAFVRFGETTEPGQRIERSLPATAAVMRCDLDGSNLELVAWGVRNAYGLAFLDDGRLIATDQGADERGSRPIGAAPDLLIEIREGAWYGWPDFVGERPVSDERHRPAGRPAVQPLLANHADLPRPERPLLEFAVNAAATKMAVIPAGAARWPGQLIVALFGDEKPMTAPPGARVGRSIVRVDPSDWTIHPIRTVPFHRPIDVAIDPDGESVWVLDFGEFEMSARGVEARPRSGALYRIPLMDLEEA